MIGAEVLDECSISTPSKIIMLVADGLGGLPNGDTRLSELETAHTPNLDKLAGVSSCGVTVPVLPGISPGSGPGHLALFGYDPLKYKIGRGALEALGVGIDLKQGQVAARGNFCTIDSEGLLSDRRAGRIPTEVTAPLCQRLDQITVEGADVRVYPVEGYRFVLLMSGEGLSDQVTETDPQRTGEAPLDVLAISPDGSKTAQVANRFVTQAREALKDEELANMVLLRGFAGPPNLPSMADSYNLSPVAIASYPMYRGLAKIAGMEVVDTGRTFSDEVETLYQRYESNDYFYIHYKPSDAAGEDGSFSGKVAALEELDTHIPRILQLKPDVFIVAGDHATPAIMAAHSWHPVPFLLHSRWTVGEGVEGFSERSCRAGSLGRFPATQIMLLALAHAGKLTKYGA